MLATVLTALFLAAEALSQLLRRLSREDSPPFLVHQPLPWKLHSVSRSRRGSRDGAKGSRQNSLRGAHSAAVLRGDVRSGSAEADDPPEKAL